MKADYTFEWYVQEIPPRCRKPRDVLHTKTVEVNIPEFRGVEVDKNAPVAIVVYKKDYGTNKKVGEEFRLYDGRLYVAQGSAAEFKNRYQCDGRIEREGDIPKTVKKIEEEWLICDDTLYRVTGEPIYRVCDQFILTDVIWDRENMDPDRFRADELFEAKRYRDALYPEYACKEDDEDYNSIEVRIPDALKLPTYLNRVDDCLEKNARKALTQELGFGALEEGLSNLMVAIMKRARKNVEFKRTSYIAPYELADIAREVILEKFK